MVRRHETVEAPTAMKVNTPPVAWQYGATLDLPTPISTHEAVIVNGWITRGAVGIGICSADGSTILDERRLAVGDESQRFQVELLRPDDPGARLVVRTTDLPTAGEVIITDLTCAPAPDTTEAWREMPIPPEPWTSDWHLHFGGHTESLAGRVRLVDLAASAETIDLPWFGGELTLDPRAEITRALAGSGTYEPGLLWALSQLVRPDDTIIMAGANSGVVPAFLAHLCGVNGLVIAVEPSPREYALLKQNTTRLTSGRAITPVPAALGVVSGSASFVPAPAASSGHGHLGDGDAAGAITVDVTTIDALADQAARPVHVIILDLEGHETAALEGARRVIDKDLPIIVAEVDGGAASDRVATQLAPQLTARGYVLMLIETGSGATAQFPALPSGASWALIALPPRAQAHVDALLHRRRLGDGGLPSWVSDGAAIERDGNTLTLTGPDIAWEYLAEWDIPVRPAAPPAHDLVEVNAGATGGPAQIVVVERADGRIIETSAVPPIPGTVRIAVPPGPAPAGRSLILRTGAAGGARVTLDAPLMTRRLPVLNPALRATARNGAQVDDVPRPSVGGIGSFTDALADGINVARLKWLSTLHLDVAGRRVVDFGAGIGMFAPFFIDRGARYLGMEGRAANIRAAQERLPGAEFVQSDLRRLTPGDVPGDIEIGLVFGLLYHLDDPRTLLDALGATPARLLVIETQVCDADLPVLLAQREPMTENQALDGRGSRPSVQWLLEATRDAGFPCAASTGVPVEHPDFSYAPLHDGSWRRDGHNLRVAFVAARDDADIPAHLVRA